MNVNSTMVTCERTHRRFTLAGRLGSGGESDVWRAYDHSAHQDVALKIRAEAAFGVGHEARVLRRVRCHPNIVGLRDVLLNGDSEILVLDLVEGCTLASALNASGAARVGNGLRWLAEVAAALDQLHGAEEAIVHGDVTPANVMVRGDGSCVLVDFGVATTSGHTQPINAGTPGFRAPEAMANEPVTPATDVYGLAAIAASILTGCDDLHDVDWRRTRTPGALALIRSALASDPAARPQHAGAFVRELQQRVAVERGSISDIRCGR